MRNRNLSFWHRDAPEFAWANPSRLRRVLNFLRKLRKSFNRRDMCVGKRPIHLVNEAEYVPMPSFSRDRSR